MALMSYPGSGNTWIRGIIERLSGYFTGSIYADKDIYVKGFYGEGVPIDCGCTIVQKTHDLQRNDYQPFINKSAILIIRNPYGALVSYRNFRTTGNSHTASASLTQFTGLEWEKFVTTEIVGWKTKVLEWIPRIGHGGILLYDDVLKDKRNQFRNLMRYLGLEVDERRLDCVIKHDFSSFKRNSTPTTNETIRDPFDASLRSIIDKEIEIVQKALADYGYDLKLLKE
ncbi:WSC domain-containing protein 2-like [Daphnia pulicaria]|uniref:WSC domain-containing protein 2-like n=1 Tax=Daphnia pulicaria TaxID=35523 RepID=UPI001EEC2D1B|nr:WSC domain-containing protein 2-like [Daphnia pulicaria]